MPGSQLRPIHWDLSQLPVFEKNFYIEHPDVSRRPEEFSVEWRREHEITVIGRGIPKVISHRYSINS
jgi:ATP-dependent RNA helicase DDX5/DBP2